MSEAKVLTPQEEATIREDATVNTPTRSYRGMDTTQGRRLLLEIDALRAEVERLALERDEWKALAAVGPWHSDCRPNRKKAAEELVKSQQRIDALATALAAMTAERDQLTARVDEVILDRHVATERLAQIEALRERIETMQKRRDHFPFPHGPQWTCDGCEDFALIAELLALLQPVRGAGDTKERT